MKGLPVIILAGTLILSVVADFVLLGGEGHGKFWWSHLYGFFAVFGFVICLAIVLISKMLGGYWLQRREDYYDRDE